jgi:hypothetical protein
VEIQGVKKLTPFGGSCCLGFANNLVLLLVSTERLALSVGHI